MSYQRGVVETQSDKIHRRVGFVFFTYLPALLPCALLPVWGKLGEILTPYSLTGLPGSRERKEMFMRMIDRESTNTYSQKSLPCTFAMTGSLVCSNFATRLLL